MSDGLSDTVRKQLRTIKIEFAAKLIQHPNLNKRKNRFQVGLMYDNRGVKLVKTGIFVGEKMAAYEFIEFGFAAKFAEEYKLWRGYKKTFKKIFGFPRPSYLD